MLTSLTEHKTRVPTIASTEASSKGIASPTWIRPKPSNLKSNILVHPHNQKACIQRKKKLKLKKETQK